ncbi:nuclear transport factor 2 family protein [Nocardia sp. NPDC051570]|uniref:nuclear transport factor 2 family protein n=1 Tax=Nocardia sp. NPDC051570 TaxID=3364324 RepID=UPI0037A16F41
MSADASVKTVESLYEAFVHGDAPGLLEKLWDDIDWAMETTSTAMPWYGVRHGKDEVASFLQQLDSTMEVKDFTPVLFAVHGSDVLTVVRFRADNRATGVPVAMDLYQRFTFRDDKIFYFRSSEDTAQMVAASHGA